MKHKTKSSKKAKRKKATGNDIMKLLMLIGVRLKDLLAVFIKLKDQQNEILTALNDHVETVMKIEQVPPEAATQYKAQMRDRMKRLIQTGQFDTVLNECGYTKPGITKLSIR